MCPKILAHTPGVWSNETIIVCPRGIAGYLHLYTEDST